MCLALWNIFHKAALLAPVMVYNKDFTGEKYREIAQDALNDVCTPGNPRPATLEEILTLYQSMM